MSWKHWIGITITVMAVTGYSVAQYYKMKHESEIDLIEGSIDQSFSPLDF